MNTNQHDDFDDSIVVGFEFDPYHMTESELADLGMEEVAYVRPVVTPNGPAFGIFAANGTPMAVATDGMLARAAIVQHDLAPASVH
ncbi:MAG TPA: DUF1150 family protein [Acetobacteraceae bacterium]|nr:DUF1150 family protein [Acetobacteraceae bacterium]